MEQAGEPAAMPAVDAPPFKWLSMAQPVSTQQEMPSVLPKGHKLASAIVIGSAALGAMVLLGALALWFHYGTAVFFEMIVSGISACF